MSRVLHLYAGNLYGGIERLLVTLAKYRHMAPETRQEFGLCFRGRVWDELTTTGATVHNLGPVRFSRPWTLWRARRRLRRLLTAGLYNVVVCHACWPHAAFASTAHASGTRLINWAHDALTGRGWVERWAGLTRPDSIIANSRFTAGTVNRVFPRSPIDVVYCPVDLSPLENAAETRGAVRKELGTTETEVVILQASRLERWKGAAVLVEALGLLRDVPGWAAWLAGGPQKAQEADYLAELKRRASELGVTNRVKFLGQRSDVPRLMAAADIYCQPNTGPEPFGIAFVEALASGLPVVSTGIGGAAEIVDETCGLLVPAGDPSSVADALQRLIGDSDLRRRLAAGGPARSAALCDPARQIGRLAELFAPVGVPR